MKHWPLLLVALFATLAYAIFTESTTGRRSRSYHYAGTVHTAQPLQ